MNNSSYWFNKNNFINGDENKFNLVWLFIIAVSLIFIGIGLRDPWPADEPRFAQVAVEMVKSGQWFFPTRGGELYPDKPPVFMWFIAVFYWLTNSITVAFLLPNAICSVITTFLVYDLGRRFWSNQIGWFAALLLLASLQFILQAKSAQIDAMVCCWITIGCYGLSRHLIERENWPIFYLGCFFMGLGVITKGVGFLPILLLIPYFLLVKFAPLENEIKGSWQWFVGLLIMLGAISLWFVPMITLVELSSNPIFEQYRDNILFKQTVKRYADSWGHILPFWYYIIKVIPFFWLPISVLFIWLIKPWKQAFINKDRRIILLLSWVVLVILFFSFSAGKRGVYMLPALPMLVLVCAPYLKDILAKKWPALILWSLIALLSIVCLLLGVVGLVEIKATIKLTSKYQVSPWIYLLTIGIIGIGISIYTYHKPRWLNWLISIPLVWVIYSTWGYHLLDQAKTPKNIFVNISKHIPEDSELAIIKFKEQFLLFSPYSISHFGYKTAAEEQLKAAWLWQKEQTNRFVLASAELDLTCFDINKAISVGYAHRRNWVILTPESQLKTCSKPQEKLATYTFDPHPS